MSCGLSPYLIALTDEEEISTAAMTPIESRVFENINSVSTNIKIHSSTKDGAGAGVGTRADTVHSTKGRTRPRR